MYKANFPFNVGMVILKPEMVYFQGVNKKMFPTIQEAKASEDNIFYCSFKTYGGTERDVNGVYSIIDTANVETWYTPKITSDVRVARLSDEAIFEVMNEPENIEQRNQFLKFKVKRIKGGA